MTPSNPILKVTNLQVYYKLRGGFFSGEARRLRAVDGVSFDLFEGEILGLVGESGCGKSSLGKAILRLIKPMDGSIEIAGSDFMSLRGKALRMARPQIQMVFQDPYASLDPRMTVYDLLAEPLVTHRSLTSQEISNRIKIELERVGLSAKIGRAHV